ncbi:CBM96 family carbohydrate-binding protein [Paenibacillus sp. Soil750]|uniref:CBM96 family carbohydrate-binding protein n=1 Tax=Paenibacillus sp. Soil750 TaxID=1736398 RepID=UPI0006F54DA5|nr:DNRLRE domain-containing protein [Paenibacillus sp. Soil750]KRE69734.1 hypothetical protein ASL11_15325 [Paenibacillus sp. Soil750]
MNDEIKHLFQVAKQDGFTVVNAQIRWMDVQPDQSYMATETTYIADGNYRSLNFSNSKTIQTGFGQEHSFSQSLAYVKFDFNCFSQGKLAGAKIRVFVTEAMAQGHSIKLYGIEDDSWDASTLTWENASNNQGYAISEAHEVTKSPSYDLVKDVFYYDFNVTEFINSYCLGDKKASFILQSETSNPQDGQTIQIDGADGAHPPQLILSIDQVYDWDYLDKVIGWAEDAGLKLEILWFGTDTCSLSIDNRVPYYVFHQYQKALTDKADGRQLLEDIPFFRKNKDPMYGVYHHLMCKNDPSLRERESTVVKAMFDHIADYNVKHGYQNTVIGCQVSNEPAVSLLHGGRRVNSRGELVLYCQCDNCMEALSAAGNDLQTYYEETMWRYNNSIATAVKESRYSVWARVNNFHVPDATGVHLNEIKRSTTGTNIDFIGLDVYSDVPKTLFTYGHAPITYIDPLHPGKVPNYAVGNNLVMNMENGGSGIHKERHGDDGHSIGTPKYANLDRLLLASLAGGGFLNVYDLCSPDELGLYENTEDHIPMPINPDAVDRLRKTQLMLNKLAHDLATKQADGAGGTMLKFFNPISDLEKSSVTKSFRKSIRSLEVMYTTKDNGVGIAVERGEKEIALVSTTASDFRLQELARHGVFSITQGFYNADNRWIGSGIADYEIIGDDVIVHMPAYGCVQVLTTTLIPAVDTYLYEAEGLPYDFSGKAKNEIGEEGGHGGHWLKISSMSEGMFGVNDFITFTVHVPSNASKYEIVTGYRSAVANGTVQLSIDGEEYGSSVDMYTTIPAFKQASAGIVSFSHSGEKKFKYTVIGKNAMSTDYQLGFDYIELIPVID